MEITPTCADTPGARPSSAVRRVLVVVEVRGVRVGVVVVVLGFLVGRGGPVGRPATDLALQGIEIHLGGAVLELSGHLRLLGLGPAAPHGSSPLQQGRGGRMSRRPRSSGVNVLGSTVPCAQGSVRRGTAAGRCPRSPRLLRLAASPPCRHPSCPTCGSTN